MRIFKCIVVSWVHIGVISILISLGEQKMNANYRHSDIICETDCLILFPGFLSITIILSVGIHLLSLTKSKVIFPSFEST